MFANFDDAFAGATTDGGDSGFTADFGAAEISSTPESSDPFPAASPSSSSTDVDAIFGSSPKTHAILLDDNSDNDAANKADDPFVTATNKTEEAVPFDEETPESM